MNGFGVKMTEFAVVSGKFHETRGRTGRLSNKSVRVVWKLQFSGQFSRRKPDTVSGQACLRKFVCQKGRKYGFSGCTAAAYRVS
jgi:hypothetical protein